MNKLRVGQKITIKGAEYEVIGILRFHTYTDYHIRRISDGKDFWLDDCNGGRFWQKISSKKFSAAMIAMLDKSAKYLIRLVDETVLNNIYINAIGTEPVTEAIGEVDETEPGEKVFYLEGLISGAKKWNLFVAELWGEGEDVEVECYKGKVVEVEVVIP